MSHLNEFFRGNGYAIHRSALRPERLPVCCRSGLRELTIGVKTLASDGSETVVPLAECRECGRKYAVFGKKYLPIDNLMKFEVVKMQ